MQDPNSKTFQTIFKNKQRLHFFLYAELIYIVILLLTVIYAFPIFMRLIVIQFAVIAIMLIGSGLLNWYDKKTGRAVVAKKDHEFFLKTFIDETPTQKVKSVFRMISFITILAAFVMVFFGCAQIFTDLSVKVKPSDLAIIENLLLLVDSFYVLTMFGIMCGLLFGKKRMERNSSLAAGFLSLVLIAFHPESWLLFTIGLLASVSGYTLYRLNQL